MATGPEGTGSANAHGRTPLFLPAADGSVAGGDALSDVDSASVDPYDRDLHQISTHLATTHAHLRAGRLSTGQLEEALRSSLGRLRKLAWIASEQPGTFTGIPANEVRKLFRAAKSAVEPYLEQQRPIEPKHLQGLRQMIDLARRRTTNPSPGTTQKDAT